MFLAIFGEEGCHTVLIRPEIDWLHMAVDRIPTTLYPTVQMVWFKINRSMGIFNGERSRGCSQQSDTGSTKWMSRKKVLTWRFFHCTIWPKNSFLYQVDIYIHYLKTIYFSIVPDDIGGHILPIWKNHLVGSVGCSSNWMNVKHVEKQWVPSV